MDVARDSNIDLMSGRKIEATCFPIGELGTDPSRSGDLSCSQKTLKVVVEHNLGRWACTCMSVTFARFQTCKWLHGEP